MLCTVADRVNTGIGRPQLVVHHDAAVHRQPGGPRESDARPYAAGEDDHVGVGQVTVCEFHAAYGAVLDAQPAHPALRVDFDTQRLDVRPQQGRGTGVQLPFHHMLALLREQHRYTALGQRTGRGHTEQPAADHHGARPRPGGGRGERRAVVQGAEGVDAVGQLVVPGREEAAQRRQHRVGAGREDEPVVRYGLPVVAQHRTGRPVDPYRPHPAQPPHAVVRGGQRDDLVRVPAGQHLGEQDTVVRRVRLLTEDGERRAAGAVGAGRAEALREPGGRHAAADHHHTLLRGHVRQRAVPLLPVRICVVTRGERCPQRGGGRGVRGRGGSAGGGATRTPALRIRTIDPCAAPP